MPRTRCTEKLVKKRNFGISSRIFFSFFDKIPIRILLAVCLLMAVIGNRSFRLVDSPDVKVLVVILSALETK